MKCRVSTTATVQLAVNWNTERYCQLSFITEQFICMQYWNHVYIKLGYCDNSKDDNSNANIKSEKYFDSLHKPVIPIIIAQLPCAHMANLQYENPKWSKLTSLKLRFSLQFWYGMEENVLIKWSMKSFEKNPCSFEVKRVLIKANEFYNDTIIDE